MKLTKTGFKTYLEANPRKNFTPRGGCSCPVAKYLGQDRFIIVRPTYYLERTGAKEFKLPVWAQKFIAAFDATVPEFDPDVKKTGAFALKVLEKI